MPPSPGCAQVAPAGTQVFVQGHDAENLTCAVCLEVLREPVMFKGGACSHSFCRECLVAHLRTARNCPECRAGAPRRGRCVWARSRSARGAGAGTALLGWGLAAGGWRCGGTDEGVWRLGARRVEDAVMPNVLAQKCVAELRVHCRHAHRARCLAGGRGAWCCMEGAVACLTPRPCQVRAGARW